LEKKKKVVGMDRSTIPVVFSPSRYRYTMLLLIKVGHPYDKYSALKFGLFLHAVISYLARKYVEIVVWFYAYSNEVN
jgi:hypothetical protein